MKIHIQGGTLIDPVAGTERQADVFVADGKIAALAQAGTAPAGFNAEKTIDASGLIVAPGLVAAARGVDDATVADQDLHASFPARMDITAMRTAMPNVTCGRITERGPSATAESISTPRFIGPGCMTMASGLASASRSGVRP